MNVVRSWGMEIKVVKGFNVYFIDRSHGIRFVALEGVGKVDIHVCNDSMSNSLIEHQCYERPPDSPEELDGKCVDHSPHS